MGQPLVIALLRLGDLLQSFPAITDLNRTNGEAGVTLLAPKDLAPLGKLHPAVNKTIPFNGDELLSALLGDGNWSDRGLSYLDGLLKDIAVDAPGLVANLTHTSFSANLAGMVPHARVRGRSYTRELGSVSHGVWSCYFFSLLSSRACNPFNLVDIFRDIAGRMPGDKTRLRLSEQQRQTARDWLAPAGQKLKVAVALGANHPLRCWPVSHWIDTLKLIRQQTNCTFVLLGGSEEKPNAIDVVNNLKRDCIDLSGQTDLPELAAVIDQCELFLGHDSGPLHLAAMLGKTAVGVYLAMASAWETAAYHPGSVAIEPDIHCHPCPESSTCREPLCHRKITPAAVAKAALAVIQGEHLQPGNDCFYRISRMASDGRLDLAGDRRSSDKARRFWRNFAVPVFEPDRAARGIEPVFNGDLEDIQIQLRNFKNELLELIDATLQDVRSRLSTAWVSYHDPLSAKHQELLALYPLFRPLLDFYHLEVQMGNGKSMLNPLEKTLNAQETLLQRTKNLQQVVEDTNGTRAVSELMHQSLRTKPYARLGVTA